MQSFGSFISKLHKMIKIMQFIEKKIDHAEIIVL